MLQKIIDKSKENITLPLTWVFTVVTLILSLGIGYGTYQTEFKATQEKVTRLEASQEAIAQTYERNNERVERLTNAIVRLEARIEGLDKNIERINKKEDVKSVLGKVTTKVKDIF